MKTSSHADVTSRLTHGLCCVALPLLAGAVSCGTKSPGSDDTGGEVSSGGASTVPFGSGGSTPVPPTNGGAPGAGGSIANGGAPQGGGPSGSGATGAVPGSGGTTDTGASGGTTGAVPGSGGAPGSGGSTEVTGDPSRGCGQGTKCTPGTDLAPPADGAGIQVAIPPGSVTVQPGQEQFLCYYKSLPGSAEVDVGAFQSWMSPESSHHFIAFQTGAGVLGSAGNQPDGTLVTCGFGTGTWLYATSVAGEVIELDMPQGVGLPLAAGSQIILNMHFINTTTEPLQPELKLNLLYAQNIQYKAGAMVSFNTGIDVPPDGTQTVSGTCTAPVGSNFFAMTTHTHKHATLAQVNYISGGQTMNIVNTTDWEHPDVGLWNAPNFLTVKQGDSFTYSCSYQNNSAQAVTVGETAATNEMCMSIGYYFPAGSAGCR
jgi:hypothetical protein